MCLWVLKYKRGKKNQLIHTRKVCFLVLATASSGCPWGTCGRFSKSTCWTQVDKMCHSSFKTLSELVYFQFPETYAISFHNVLLKMNRTAPSFISRRAIFRFSIRRLSLLLRLGILQSKTTQRVGSCTAPASHPGLLAQMWLHTVPARPNTAKHRRTHLLCLHRWAYADVTQAAADLAQSIHNLQ